MHDFPQKAIKVEQVDPQDPTRRTRVLFRLPTSTTLAASSRATRRPRERKRFWSRCGTNRRNRYRRAASGVSVGLGGVRTRNFVAGEDLHRLCANPLLHFCG